jgi:hypothetical protein
MGNDRRLSGAQSEPRAESDIRFNYADLNKLVAASNVDATSPQAQFYSSDGGATWGQTLLPFYGSDNNHSDPAVEWTSDGTAWALTMSLGANVYLRAYRSPDGGQTWNFDDTPSGSQSNVDKELIWVDHSPTSPYRDHLYCIWHNGGPAFFNYRTGPSGSWQTVQQLSGVETTGTAVGADVKTNSDGVVFSFWPDTGSGGLFVATSTNGGQSFAGPVQIATSFGRFKVLVPAQDQRGCLIYLSGGAYKDGAVNMVYAVWTDLSGDSGCTSGSGPGSDVTSTCKTRIWFARSTDGGANWDPPVKLNDQSSLNDQFFPRLAVDDANGDLMVVYYDTENDPDRLQTDLWMQSSNDHGATWSAALQVTSAESNESAASDSNQYGDYIGLTGYQGQFFACWTDTRDGINEIWGSPLTLVPPAISFYMEETTYSQDEVNLQLPGTADFAAGWIAVDGLRPEQLTLTTVNLNNPPSSSLFTTGYQVDPALPPGVQNGIKGMLTGPAFAGAGGVVAQDPTLPNLPQRLLFPFLLEFSSDSGFVDMVNDAITAADISLSAALAVTAGSYSNQTEIELTTGEDPRFEDVNPKDPLEYPSWLSFDLRFFTMTVPAQGGMVSRFQANLTGPSDAAKFIADVITNLTGGTTGSDTFDSLSQEEEGTSSLAFNQKDNSGNLVYNFAVARVRLVAKSSATARTVRVFFRLFQAQNTASNFDDSTTYRYWTDGTINGVKVPLLGVGKDQNGNPEYVTIPCFASGRIDPTTQSMSEQRDTPNAHDLAGTGTEKKYYFGCWIDNNQPTAAIMPAAFPSGSLPPAGQASTAFDGPWPTGTLETMLTAFNAFPHQCLIAEIRYDDTPIPPGVTSTFDKLAQRNIAWIDA